MLSTRSVWMRRWGWRCIRNEYSKPRSDVRFRRVRYIQSLGTRPHQNAGGGGGIRTPETLTGLTVFKTAGLNHSPTPPLAIVTRRSLQAQASTGAGFETSGTPCEAQAWNSAYSSVSRRGLRRSRIG